MVGVLVALLDRSGVLGWALDLFGRATRWAVRGGFRVWERWLSWANWWVYLLLALALLVVGGVAARPLPAVALVCAALTLTMGVSTCLAYMFIDVERYEVERGRKAVHNPTKGQDLAANVALYGHRVGVPLLIAAAAGVIGGFVLLNQGFYESVGRGWYKVDADSRPGFIDFLTYAVINLLSLVDILNVADSRHLLHATFVKKGDWPAAVMLGAFRSFFTLILLQQVFASVRQGRLLSETIADCWSPHEPIHDRARNALPQFGANAVGPVLLSLLEMTSLTKEQRDQLPIILAAIGPSTIPTLIRHLSDPHEHVRAVAAAALGHLGAREATAEVAALVADASDLVRVSAVDALGLLAAAGVQAERRRAVRRPRRAGPGGGSSSAAGNRSRRTGTRPRRPSRPCARRWATPSRRCADRRQPHSAARVARRPTPRTYSRPCSRTRTRRCAAGRPRRWVRSAARRSNWWPRSTTPRRRCAPPPRAG